ncbi:MAG: hypothetical protein KGO96_07115 [Elusimicrobia bacterium]|nr:hypothetical protein [Elusimicrobiota bacterium]
MGWSFTNDCKLSLKQRSTLLQLGSFSADRRGGQSWGTLIVDDNGLPVVEKGMGPLIQIDFEKLASAQMGYAHSRYATRGKINLKNSHPFEYGNIIGAHNGVISNAAELDHIYGRKEVDSEHIFERISEKEGLSKFRGYGVIEFYDKEVPNALFLANIGNGDVTLFEIENDTKSHTEAFYWTSLMEDGELALAGAGIKDFESYELTEGTVFKFVKGENCLYSLESKLRVKPNKRQFKNERINFLFPEIISEEKEETDDAWKLWRDKYDV